MRYVQLRVLQHHVAEQHGLGTPLRHQLRHLEIVCQRAGDVRSNIQEYRLLLASDGSNASRVAGFILCAVAGLLISAIAVTGVTIGVFLLAMAIGLSIVGVRATGNKRSLLGLVAGIGLAIDAVAVARGLSGLALVWFGVGLLLIAGSSAARFVGRRTA